MSTIVVRLHGGLGNQLFQLLAARYQRSLTPGANIEIYTGDLGFFKTSRSFEIEPLLKAEHILNHVSSVDKYLFRFKVSKFLSKYSVHSISTVSQLLRWRGQFLNGYFHDVFNYHDFALVNSVVKEIDADLQRVAPIDVAALPFDPAFCCAIHLRLTDFLQIAKGASFLLDYRLPLIKKTIEQLRAEKKVQHFIVFTDDPTKAKELLNEEEVSFFADYSDIKLNLLQEFNLISKFSYLLPSNSTFSYWTSILGGDKTIYFPTIWKNDDLVENEVFQKNIQVHSSMFPHGNKLRMIDR